MAITLNNTVASGPTAINTTASAGDLVVVCLSASITTGGTTITGITDTSGNTYFQVPGAFESNGTNALTDIWYSNITNSLAGNVTIAYSHGGIGGSGITLSLSGTAQTSPVDIASARYTPAGLTQGDPISITNPGDFLIAVSFANAGGWSNAGAPWTLTTGTILGAYVLNPGATGSYQVTFNNAAPVSENGVSTAAFLPFAAPATNIGNMFLVF